MLSLPFVPCSFALSLSLSKFLLYLGFQICKLSLQIQLLFCFFKFIQKGQYNTLLFSLFLNSSNLLFVLTSGFYLLGHSGVLQFIFETNQTSKSRFSKSVQKLQENGLENAPISQQAGGHLQPGLLPAQLAPAGPSPPSAQQDQLSSVVFSVREPPQRVTMATTGHQRLLSFPLL